MNTVKTRILEPNSEGIAKALRLLEQGELVVFPSETVYGLGAQADSDSAVQKIYEAKGRPADNPLIVHVQDRAMAESYCNALQEVESFLFDEFAPGPLSIVCARRQGRAETASAGLASIALRIPSAPLVQSLIAGLGSGIAAPSANISGEPSPTDFAMALRAMNGRAVAIFRGSACNKGIESTVVRCSSSAVEILRPGSVSSEQIRSALGRAGFAQAVRIAGQGSVQSVLSPGTRYRHYAPQSPVSLYTSAEELARIVQSHSDRLSSDDRVHTDRVQTKAGASAETLWIIAPTSPARGGEEAASHPFFAPGDISAINESLLTAQEQNSKHISVVFVESARQYSHELYRIFYNADVKGKGRICAYLPPQSSKSEALRDRLMRSAGIY